MNIIAVLNQKGGVGKTTTSINLGAYLAKTGNRVLIIDFDPQANATSGLGINRGSVALSIYDVMFNNVKAKDAVLPTNLKNLYVIPATSALADAEINLTTILARELVLKNSTDDLEFDYILIDCPPALGLLTVNALAASNWLLIPVQAEYYALEGLSQLLDTLQKIRQGINPGIELLGVLATMVDSRTSLSDQVVSELKKYFGDKLLNTRIPRNIKLAEAPSFGTPISEYEKWSKGARAYKQLAKEVASRVN